MSFTISRGLLAGSVYIRQEWVGSLGMDPLFPAEEGRPLESSRSPPFSEAFHANESLVFGRSNLNNDFSSIARARRLIPW
jgi:hypothetical protein